MARLYKPLATVHMIGNEFSMSEEVSKCYLNHTMLDLCIAIKSVSLISLSLSLDRDVSKWRDYSTLESKAYIDSLEV